MVHNYPALVAHPLADIFPLIDGDAFAELVEDIRRHGLREPIVVYGGRILDGRNRYRAVQAAGVPLRMRDFDPATDGDETAFVISANLHRRHLTASQRAMIAAQLARLGHGGARGKPSIEGLPAHARAALLKVGRASVERAEAVIDHGDKDIIAAVVNGSLAVSAAAQIATLPLDQQRDILRAAAPKAIGAIVREFRQARTARQAVQRENRETALGARLRAANDDLAAIRGQRRYGVILADPEWRYQPWPGHGMQRAAENHYPTSTTEEIAARPVADLAADDAVLFLWAVSPMLPDAFEVMSAWGFSYRTNLVWAKQRSGRERGMGYWLSGDHELLLIGTKGSIPIPAPGEQLSSVISAPVGAHSEKPTEVYDLIESYFPSLPKIELNARKARPGWASWGAEAPTGLGTDQHAR